MRFPIDFKARLEDLNRRRLTSGGGSGRVAKQWSFTLVFGLLMTLIAILGAGYRFLYWSDADNYSPAETSDSDLYDLTSLEAVLDAYDAKEERVSAVLGRDWTIPVPEAATNTPAL